MLVEAVDDHRRTAIEAVELVGTERGEWHVQRARQMLLPIDGVGEHVDQGCSSSDQIQQDVDIDACGHGPLFPGPGPVQTGALWQGGVVQLTPRYGSDPVIVIDGPPMAVAAPALRQRRRLAATLADLSDDQWASPSRCAGWSVRDVIAHLEPTNSFWALSISAGVAGHPTTFLTTFDPVASPAQMVAGTADRSTNDVFQGFLATNEALIRTIEGLSGADWSAVAEAPPGHVGVGALVHHALWDAWVHERDIVLPLGLEPVVETDEVDACLRYVTALAPAFRLTRGEGATGHLAVDVTQPDISFGVHVGDRVMVDDDREGVDLALTGSAVELLEALSCRAPLQQSVPPEHRWLIDGLATVFDRA